VGWVEHHPILAVFLPAILPPPPSPFVLAAGALGVSRNRFFVVFGAARCLRYSLITWLGVVYGRHVMRLWSGTLQRWSGPILWVFGALLVAAICFGLWKVRGLRKPGVTAKKRRVPHQFLRTEPPCLLLPFAIFKRFVFTSGRAVQTTRKNSGRV